MRWPTGTVRLRTTMAATLLTAFVLTLASIAIVRLVERDLEQSATDALNAALENASHASGAEGTEEGSGEDGAGEDSGGEPQVVSVQSAMGPLFFVYTGNGNNTSGTIRGVLVDDQLTESVALIEIDLTTRAVTGLTAVSNQPIQDLQPIVVPDSLQPGLSGDEQQQQLADASIREVRDAVNAASNALLIIVPLVVAVLGAAIWFTVGRALRPVRAISDQVASITSSTLDERVPEPGSGDEIAELAALMNEMLDRLQTGAERQQEFVADASHELRSPLSTIKAAAEIAQVSQDPTKLKSLANKVASEATRMELLIGDLLDLARLDEQRRPGTTAAVNLTSLCSEVIKRLDPDTAVNVELVGLELATISGVENQLEQAVFNLAANALSHADTEVRLTIATADNHVQVIVDDDGAGIDPADRERVFERFVRLDHARDRSSGGTGIGLAVVKAVASRHNGTITATEAPDLAGARFILDLPINEPV